MQKILFILSIFLWVKFTPIYAFQLSQKSQISIITGTPGQDLYALFGHSGIRVYDALYGIDIMYNYGTFDFDEPNFMGKFVQGRLKYSLSKENYAAFISFYASQGRPVYEQVLNLDATQKQAIVDYLENNFLPQNRYYLYDFFYDNCSTRVRDVLEKALKGQVKFDSKPSARKRTFRDYINPYTQEMWLNLGITLILGQPADKIPNYQEKMFLPDRLQDAMEDTKILTNKGEYQPLVLKTEDIVKGMKNTTQNSFLNPYSVFWTLFLVISWITYWGVKNQKHSFGLDFSLFLLMGLLGLFFMGMGIFTDHKAVKWNWNIVWALPTHFLVVWLFLMKKKPIWLNYYFAANCIILGLVFASWFVFPQKLHSSLIPILLILLVRSGKIYYWLANK